MMSKQSLAIWDGAVGTWKIHFPFLAMLCPNINVQEL
jgi:hypothetical protein